jgi:hypothetical protein
MSKAEINEVLRFVSHVRTEVATDDTVPGRVTVYFLSDSFLMMAAMSFLDVALLGRAVDDVLLYVLSHVCTLDDSLTFTHDCQFLVVTFRRAGLRARLFFLPSCPIVPNCARARPCSRTHPCSRPSVPHL